MTTISLSSSTTITLSVPATTGIWPGGNPSQSMNAMIKFTGAQTGNATILFTLPGFYIVNNQCTGTSFVRLQNVSGAGNYICAPPGEKVHVFFDGTDMDYVDLGRVGEALDLHINTTTVPLWISASSPVPYLVKDGSVYTSSVYPALAALLGSTFGGNGVTTFGVPDERNRMRIPVDTIQSASGTTSQRVTNALNGVIGTTLGAAGGTSAPVLTVSQLPTGITGTVTVPTGGKQIPLSNGAIASFGALGGGAFASPYDTSGAPGWTGTTALAGTMTSNNTLGSSHSVLNPTIVSFLALIKT